MRKRHIILSGLLVLIISLFATAAASADSVSYAGAWQLNEGSGNIAGDTSGNNDNGTIETGTTWVTGSFGTALSFDGSDGGVDIPDAPALAPPTQVSVGAYVSHAGSPGVYRYVVAKGATGCISASYAIYTGANGGLEFYVSNGHGQTYVLSADAGQGIWDGNWHLVVGTYDGSELRLYVDGVEVGNATSYSQPLSYALVNSNDLFIGDYPGCVAHQFNGDIKDVAVWDTALSAAQVAALEVPATTGPGSGSSTPVTSTPVTPIPSPPTPVSAASGQATGTQSASALASRPRLSNLKITPAKLAVIRTRAVAAHQKATISYSDTQAARTTLTVYASRLGVESAGKRCVTPKRSARTTVKPNCRTLVKLGFLTHADKAGVNHIALSAWRVGGHYLAAGRYLLRAIPTRSGVTGGAASTIFAVTAPTLVTR